MAALGNDGPESTYLDEVEVVDIGAGGLEASETSSFPLNLAAKFKIFSRQRHLPEAP